MKTRPLRSLFLLAAVIGGCAATASAGTFPESAPFTRVATPEEAPGKITGIPIVRAKGGFLGIEIVEGHFKLSFYNPKKKPVQADVARAALRWSVHYQPNDERTVLLPDGDGTALSSPKPVRPPLSFQLHIALFAEGSDDAVESYVIDFHG